jgi:hypothetical protein
MRPTTTSTSDPDHPCVARRGRPPAGRRDRATTARSCPARDANRRPTATHHPSPRGVAQAGAPGSPSAPGSGRRAEANAVRTGRDARRLIDGRSIDRLRCRLSGKAFLGRLRLAPAGIVADKAARGAREQSRRRPPIGSRLRRGGAVPRLAEWRSVTAPFALRDAPLTITVPGHWVRSSRDTARSRHPSCTSQAPAPGHGCTVHIDNCAPQPAEITDPLPKYGVQVG